MRKTLLQTLLAAFCATLACASLEGGGVMLIVARSAFTADGKPTARDYVQDGLVAMWDGIENAGWGKHDPNATAWTDVVGGLRFAIPDGGYWLNNALTSSKSIILTGDRYVRVGMHKPLVESLEGTLELCWIDNINVEKISPDLNNGSGQGIRFYVRNLSGVGRIYNAAGQMNGASTHWWGTGLRIGVLHTLVFRMREGEKCELYVDGEFKEYSQANCNMANNAFLINSNYNWSVTIKKVNPDIWHSWRIYSRALSAEEVAHNYAIDQARFNQPDI